MTFSVQLLEVLGNDSWLKSKEVLNAPLLAKQQSDYVNYRYLSWFFLGAVWQINGILRALNFTQLASNLMIYWVIAKGALALLLLLPQSPLFYDNLVAISIVHGVTDISFALISLYMLHKKVHLKWLSLSA